MGKKDLTPTEVAQADRRLKIAKLMASGVTNRAEISRQVGCSSETVKADMRLIHEEWVDSRKATYEVRQAELLEQLEELYRVTWESFEASKKPSVRSTRKVVAGSEVEQVNTVEQREEGNPAILRSLIEIIKQRSEILGMKVHKFAITDSKGGDLMTNLMNIAEHGALPNNVVGEEQVDAEVKRLLATQPEVVDAEFETKEEPES